MKLPLCFSAQQVPSEKMSTLKGKNLLPVPSKKGATLKRKNLLSLVANSFLSEKNPFQKELLFVCVEVLWPSQPHGVMLSVDSLPNHSFTGQA